MSATSAKATLIGLGLLFVVPLVLAWLMYTGVIEYAPRDPINRGTLIEPAVEADIPEEFERRGLSGHWILAYPISSACGNQCRQDLTGLRQVRRALGRERDRVRIVPLLRGAPDGALLQDIETIGPGIAAIIGADGLYLQLGEIEGGRGTYLIDPLGNIMMHYQPGFDPNDIRLDLERLLNYAKTDSQR